ncbi:CMRF35-like molecule 1 [Colossoma macropomum]|uniref:CMRF35-like molecule 1 n=1 Tax=Colossoma macropomum TaxID=42526 RepID=UPI0018640891|nr:CMRF35-like molecule 1 [Colossoma macropomum]
MDCLLMFIFFISSIESRSWSERQLSLQTGGTITIPCHYDMKYIQHKKYWCYNAGGGFNYCTILAYENTTKDRVTVTDYPAQSLFTVTMRDLQSGDTGMYWCVVEIGGITEVDDKKDIYITVKSAPDLSVVESSVSGQKGGNVSVQCLYSAGYQNEQKQWCRSKDWSCYTVGRADTSQNSAVQISDDGRSSFSVEMSGLQQSDAGWYWCYIGDLQVPVHLSVSDAPPATKAVTSVSATEETSISEATLGSATVTTNTESATDLRTTGSSSVMTSENVNSSPGKSGREQDGNGEILLVWVLLAVGLGLLLILFSIIICVLREKFKKSETETRERSNDTAVQTSSSALEQEHGVVYSSVVTATRNKTLSPAGGDDGVIYNSVVSN